MCIALKCLIHTHFLNYLNLLYNAVPLIEIHSEPSHISCFSGVQTQSCLHRRRQRALHL